jgi:ABC-type Mn2+/Zn2+ transport system permease subunit
MILTIYLAIGLLWFGIELVYLSLKPESELAKSIRSFSAQLNLNVYVTITILGVFLIVGWIFVLSIYISGYLRGNK